MQVCKKKKRIFENVFNDGGQMPTERTWLMWHWRTWHQNWLSLKADSLNIRLKANSWNEKKQNYTICQVNKWSLICFWSLFYLIDYMYTHWAFSFYAKWRINAEMPLPPSYIGRREKIWLFNNQVRRWRKVVYTFKS
jgi:hypothetical protein